LEKHNFYAGPSIIAASVLEQASQAVMDYKGSGLSLLEYSHRSDEFGEIISEAIQLVKQIGQLDDDFEVLFLQGGGRQQFFQVPYNLASTNLNAAYIDTGSWAAQALKEAAHFGNTAVVASSKNNDYKSIPNNIDSIENPAYLHLTTNNTIYGTQFHQIPKFNAPIVADMSSDIFCRPLDYNKFGLVYSAAQKNAGTAGATVVIVRKSILKKEVGSIPTMIDYRTHIQKKSLYNTPPSFAIYMSLLVLRWIVAEGGLAHFGLLNQKKADVIYQEIDRNSLFRGHAEKADRSIMNAVFTLVSDNNELESRFLQRCAEAGIVGIKGHSSVGGFRASMYNALPLKSVQVLVETMKSLETDFG